MYDESPVHYRNKQVYETYPMTEMNRVKQPDYNIVRISRWGVSFSNKPDG